VGSKKRRNENKAAKERSFEESPSPLATKHRWPLEKKEKKKSLGKGTKSAIKRECCGGG